MTAIFNEALANPTNILAELAKGPTGYFLAFLGIGLFFATISIAPYLAKRLAALLRGGVYKLAGARRGRWSKGRRK